jgi:hypothetical protein
MGLREAASDDMELPGFNEFGLLPPGDYEMSLASLRESMLVTGPPDRMPYPNWDTPWRRHLVDQLEILCAQLWDVGVINVFIDGSFAEDKEHPNDIDGYFECTLEDLASGRLARELNMLDPYKIWTWDTLARKPYRGYEKKQLPMWHRYRVELYPHYSLQQLSGLRDEYGNELTFPSAFRRSRRNNVQRGIVKIERDDRNDS